MAEDLESLLSGKINIPEIRMAASLAVTAPENRLLCGRLLTAATGVQAPMPSG